jgi:hypothetical protein
VVTDSGYLHCSDSWLQLWCPIACLKVMELFSRIDRARVVDCYKKARIRKVVFEEWDYMVQISDKHGSLTVKDT